jgi:FkbM family methyltransferase
MNIAERIRQRFSLVRSSSHPIPLIADSFRLKQRDYEAECKDLRFRLRANCGEWFTIFENVIREDYFQHGIRVAPGDTVIDIGANFGSFAAVASQKVGADGAVLSFEPDPVVYSRLIKTIELNGFTNVKAFNEAVTDKDGELTFYVHPKSAFSTLMETVGNRRSSDLNSITVRSRTINDVIKDVDGTVHLLKIDCEGAEYSILDSLDADLAKGILQISMEVHEVPNRKVKEVPAMLRNLGFRVQDTCPLTAFRDA